LLSKNGKVWLPNLKCIEESLEDFNVIITEYFDISLVSDALENPLFLATENVEKQLLLCPDNLTNKTQIKPLLANSSKPFYVLTLKKNRNQPSTPQRGSKKRSVIDNPVVGGNVEYHLVTPTKKRRQTVAKK